MTLGLMAIKLSIIHLTLSFINLRTLDSTDVSLDNIMKMKEKFRPSCRFTKRNNGFSLSSFFLSLLSFLWIGAQFPQEKFLSYGRILTLHYYFLLLCILFSMKCWPEIYVPHLLLECLLERIYNFYLFSTFLLFLHLELWSCSPIIRMVKRLWK